MSLDIVDEAPGTVSDEILRDLLATAGNNRRRDTLTRLKQACDHLAQRRQPITLAAIQEEVERVHGKDAGPKAQSISNEKQHSPSMYRYVAARRREQAAIQARPARSVSKTPIADAIDEIEDIDIQSRMRDLADQLDVARRDLGRARALFKVLRPGVEFDELVRQWQKGSEPTVPAIAGPSGGSQVPANLVLALQRLLSLLQDNGHLSTCGLMYDGNRVKRKPGTTGDTLIEAPLLAAVKELFKILSRATGSGEEPRPSETR